MKYLASLKFTVGLLIASMVLVFVGTLAQMDSGIWTVVKLYFRSWFVWVPLQLFVRLGQIFLSVPTGVQWPDAYGFPFPGGWTIGVLLLVNLLAAHTVRFKLSWKRGGVILLHLGLIVMLVGELVTGLFAREYLMPIDEGQSANFLQDSRAYELAVIDTSDAKTDAVTVVPWALFRGGQTIRDERLPFEMTIERSMANSELPDQTPAGFQNPATAGAGSRLAAVEKPEVSGTDPNQKHDMPSAYVRLKSRSGQDLGVWLVSMWLKSQSVTVDGKTYEIGLRHERAYVPYTVHLIDFRYDRYLGTQIAKNYSSLVRLVDPETGEDREIKIAMNDPLRYRGKAYFQASFDPSEKGTILQVVDNPGWLLPYISCALVTLGMTFHFAVNLIGFLEKRAGS